MHAYIHTCRLMFCTDGYRESETDSQTKRHRRQMDDRRERHACVTIDTYLMLSSFFDRLWNMLDPGFHESLTEVTSLVTSSLHVCPLNLQRLLLHACTFESSYVSLCFCCLLHTHTCIQLTNTKIIIPCLLLPSAENLESLFYIALWHCFHTPHQLICAKHPRKLPTHSYL